MDTESLGKRLVERIGQTVLTCPTANCFDGLPAEERRLTSGRALRVFGDGFQASRMSRELLNQAGIGFGRETNADPMGA